MRSASSPGKSSSVQPFSISSADGSATVSPAAPPMKFVSVAAIWLTPGPNGSCLVASRQLVRSACGSAPGGATKPAAAPPA